MVRARVLLALGLVIGWVVGCGDSAGGESEGGTSPTSTSTSSVTSMSTLDSSSSETESGVDSMTGTGTSAGTSAEAGSETTSGPEVMLSPGTYSLIRYDLDGGGLTDINDTNRRDAFLIHLDDAAGVLHTAACIEPGLNESPANSPCRISESTTEWQCQCYGYAISGNVLALEPFDEGAAVPMVEVGAGSFEATLGDSPPGFLLSPLPAMEWGSDGVTSLYVMEPRADMVFDQVLDDPDGRPTCDPC